MQLRELVKYWNGNFAIVALNSFCNCRCSMCDLWKFDFKIDMPKFIANLDRLAANNFKILQLTGGEPTMLRELPELIRAAREKGFFVQMMTNGTTMNDQLARKLAEAGLNFVSISVDHYEDAVASEYRKFPHINERIRETVRLLKAHGIPSCSTTLLTRHNFQEIEKVVDFVNNELGIPFSFCNPEKADNYFLTADLQKDANLTKDELVQTVKRILKMKRRGAAILNTKAHINNTLAWLEKGQGNYICKAGKNVIFIDWNMNVFPCFKKPKMSSLDELGPDKLKELNCDECMVQCFREPSIFYHGLGKLEYLMDFGVLFRAFEGTVKNKPQATLKAEVANPANP